MRQPKPSATEPHALVSIGTNSTRLLMLGEDDAVLAVESQGTRLGAGLRASGRLDPAARERTLAAIDGYLATVREHRARVACIATSAMRRASDGASFAAELEARFGAPPRILTGEEEATYSFLGATARLGAQQTVGVLDVGGGSSELAVDVPARARAAGHVAFTGSVEIGAVRLSERHPAVFGEVALAPPERAQLVAALRADAREALAPYAEAPRPQALIVVGGTAFTAAAMVAMAPLRDGVTFSHAQRAELVDTLLARNLEERRRLPFIRPQRADILPAGLVIIDEACALLDRDVATVSVDDLLSGFLHGDAYAQSARMLA